MKGSNRPEYGEITIGSSDVVSDDDDDVEEDDDGVDSADSNSLLTRASSSSDRRREGGGSPSSVQSSPRRETRPTIARGSRAVARSTFYYYYWLRNHTRLLQTLAVVAVLAGTAWVHERGVSYQPSTSLKSQLSVAADEGPPLPDLHTLIGDFESDVRGNVSWLMDFAIIGHSKCATTATQEWLRHHPEILMDKREIHSLRNGKPAEMVSILYALHGTSPGQRQRRGYKEPNDIRSAGTLQYLRTYWPDARLIVGVRHPVKWFESYYNYNTRRADHGKNGSHHFEPAEVMEVPDHARFHLHLSQLGKTNVLDPGEQELLGPRVTEQPVAMSNKVFLYEVSQPFDSREGRDEQYRRDLQQFLGLSSPLRPLAVRSKRGGNYHYAIDICDRKYESLRHQLVEDGKVAAEWIAKYFLPHPDVTVSSPDHFREILRSWSTDPCINT